MDIHGNINHLIYSHSNSVQGEYFSVIENENIFYSLNSTNANEMLVYVLKTHDSVAKNKDSKEVNIYNKYGEFVLKFYVP